MGGRGGLGPGVATPSNPVGRSGRQIRRIVTLRGERKARPQGQATGTRCGPLKGLFRGCPRNCKRRASSKKPLDADWRPGRWKQATTREPGDRPELVTLPSHGACEWGGPTAAVM